MKYASTLSTLELKNYFAYVERLLLYMENTNIQEFLLAAANDV